MQKKYKKIQKNTKKIQKNTKKLQFLAPSSCSSPPPLGGNCPVPWISPQQGFTYNPVSANCQPGEIKLLFQNDQQKTKRPSGQMFIFQIH